jgi:hypothetical protein
MNALQIRIIFRNFAPNNIATVIGAGQVPVAIRPARIEKAFLIRLYDRLP